MPIRHILLATAEPTERRAFEAAFAGSCPQTRLTVACDAEALLGHLDTQGVHAISFALLDLDLPGLLDGDTLERLGADLKYRSLPVIVMSDTADGEAVVRTYLRGASAFVRKPADDAGRQRMARATCGFWLDINVVPKPEVSLI